MTPTFLHRDNLLHNITNRIRQSLDLPTILATAVTEIRQFLAIDRVMIYRFEADETGQVVAEAIDQQRLPSLLHLHFPATDIPPEARALFVQARQRVITDVANQWKTVHQMDAEGRSPTPKTHDIRFSRVDPCHLNYLTAMGVQASLVLPILHQRTLWGLLTVHHSEARWFAESELQMVQLLVDQISIAIAQSELLAQARQRSFEEAIINTISQLLHCPLPTEQARQQVIEAVVEALGGIGGRLYVRPEPMTGTAQIYTVGTQPQHPALESDPAWQTFFQPSHLVQLQDVDWAIASWQADDRLFQPLLSTLPTNGHHRATHTLPQNLKVQDLKRAPESHALHEAFAVANIRSLLLVPLDFQGQFVGYFCVFRQGYDQAIQWAGELDPDTRQRLPRLSFESWLEDRKNQAILWRPEELQLAQAIGMHLYMSIMQRRVEALIRYQASHDSLTALPNRLLFAEQLALALAKHPDTMVGVAFLDLDRFKTINDALGHAVGDALLQQVAERLRGCLRQGDAIARWGGDEFTLLLPNLASAEDISAIAQHILENLNQPFMVDGQDFYITASLGLAVAPYDGQDVQTLLKNADAAMYQAKYLGKNNFQLYYEESNYRTVEHLSLESDLHKAIDRGELRLYYQPQVNLQTGQIVGLEALVRWQHPQRGMVSPGMFIPLAEETGLIVRIGEWVLREACRQQRLWQERGLTDLTMAVNLSAKQFRDVRLINQTLEILQDTGADPRWLELEITESAVMQDVPFTIALLQQLQDIGIQIALDDFGTGYSSLNAIKHFPLNTLKIDQEFVRDACQDANDAAIARTILALGQGLNLHTLAEGVETEEQRRWLLEQGCTLGQGFLFSRPLPPDEILPLLQHSQQSSVLPSA